MMRLLVEHDKAGRLSKVVVKMNYERTNLLWQQQRTAHCARKNVPRKKYHMIFDTLSFEGIITSIDQSSSCGANANDIKSYHLSLWLPGSGI